MYALSKRTVYAPTQVLFRGLVHSLLPYSGNKTHNNHLVNTLAVRHLARFPTLFYTYASVYYDIIGSDDGLSPVRRQVIIWTKVGILLIGPLGTYFNEIAIKIRTYFLMEMHLKISSAIREIMQA